MNLCFRYYIECSRQEWQAAVLAIAGSTRVHSWDYINYMSKHSPQIRNLSFLVYDIKVPLAVVSLGLYMPKMPPPGVSFSFAGSPCGMPAFANMSQATLRKVGRRVFQMLDSIAETEGVTHSFFTVPPTTGNDAEQGHIGCKNLFYPSRFGYLAEVQNSTVWELQTTEAEIFCTISKYQRKHIRQSEKAGLRIVAFSGTDAAAEIIEGKIEELRLLHLRVAGRKTREDATWQAMCSACVNGVATLFISYRGKTPVSYLFCGEYGPTAYGWTQVNVPEYESELSPRHHLEWQAALHYKARDFIFYEIGTVPYEPLPSGPPSKKEISIGLFKERYGAPLYPHVFWRKFYDLALQEQYLKSYQKNLRDFIWPECR